MVVIGVGGVCSGVAVVVVDGEGGVWVGLMSCVGPEFGSESEFVSVAVWYSASVSGSAPESELESELESRSVSASSSGSERRGAAGGAIAGVLNVESKANSWSI